LVVEAIRALRTDRDPGRAATLLAAYLRTYPHGALSEEALALSIEASAAQHDPRAATFADQYLREYPHGRFRRAAGQALERRQP
jgi:protein-tyrosine phosphatase